MEMSIISVGMVSSLGLDWKTCCAAARSGIMRAQGLQHYRVQVTDAFDIRLAVGHQVELLTRGFEGNGRLLRLLVGAFRDLLKNVPDTSSDFGRHSVELPVYLAVPDENRTGTNLALMLNQDDRGNAGSNIGEDNSGSQEPSLKSNLLGEAVRTAQWPWPVRFEAQCKSGPVALIQLLEQCSRDMDEGKCEQAIVGAVDSLLDDDTLAWLQKTGRLKTGAVPSGLMPGEAAVLFLLDRHDSSGAGMGRFQSISLDFESLSMSTGQWSRGATLTRVVRKAGERVGWPACSAPWLIADQNGESYNANEWGCAVQKLVSINNAFADLYLSLPVMSFGDTGCARLAVGTAYALAAWRRGYAHCGRCCLVGISDEGHRGAAILAAPQGRVR